MDLSTNELLSLLSDQSRAEMARLEAEQTRANEFRWILHQIEYLQQVIRESFEDFATEMSDQADKQEVRFVELSAKILELEKLILGPDRHQSSLKRQLIMLQDECDRCREEKAKLAGQVNIALDRRIEELQSEIDKIRKELSL